MFVVLGEVQQLSIESQVLLSLRGGWVFALSKSPITRHAE